MIQYFPYNWIFQVKLWTTIWTKSKPLPAESKETAFNVQVPERLLFCLCPTIVDTKVV